MAPYRGRYLKDDSAPAPKPQRSAVEEGKRLPREGQPVPQRKAETAAPKAEVPAPKAVWQAAPAVPAAPASSASPASRAGPRRAPRKPKRRYLRPGWLLVYLWLAAAIPEVLLHFATAQGGGTLFNSGLPLSVLFALVTALFIFFLMAVLPKRGLNLTVAVVYSLVTFLLCASQLVYYKIFNCFYSAYSMANGGGAFQFWRTILPKIWENILYLLGMLLPMLFLCIFGRRLFSFRPLKHVLPKLVPLAAAAALQVVLVLCLPFFGGKEELSAYDLYHNKGDAYYSLNKLGMGTAFRLDLTRLITGGQSSGSIHLDLPETPSTEVPVQTDPDATGETAEPLPDTGPNVLDLNFNALINRTSNQEMLEVHQFFQNRTPSNKNEHTGIFKGCNLILITAEAFDSIVVTEERMPTLYKLMHEGYYFSDYYVPDWGVSTTDGEYAFLTGTVPEDGVWSFTESAQPGREKYMPLTMSMQLINQGYNAYAFHGHTYTYYSRNLYLENLGYTYKAKGNGLDVRDTWPESDIEVVDKSTGDFVDHEPFITYYMTISGHREFNFRDNYITYKNKALSDNEPYSSHVRAYISGQLELERSMELLLERLDEAGVLENTVIVLTADHYPNGLTNAEMSELFGHDIETNFERFKNGCIIYKAGMTPETIDAPTSHLDLLPTLSNLFGLEFDSRLYMGRDVFSDAEPLVMFRNRSWITDKASYNHNTGEVISFTETPVTSDYVKRIKNEVSNRFTVSARVLEFDYWRILFGE